MEDHISLLRQRCRIAKLREGAIKASLIIAAAAIFFDPICYLSDPTPYPIL